jgi:hypothetical protein
VVPFFNTTYFASVGAEREFGQIGRELLGEHTAEHTVRDRCRAAFFASGRGVRANGGLASAKSKVEQM